MDTLLISLPAHGDDGIRWSVISSGASGATPVLTGSLGDCTHAAQGRRVIVLAPSEALLLACVKLTARNRTQLIKALPYALEEQLAQDIDDLHFAVGNKLADGRYPAAVVAKTRMSAWLDALETAGIQATSLIPDVLSLPAATPAEWQVLIEPSRALVRLNAVEGFACEPQILAPLLMRAHEAATDKPQAIRVHLSGEPPSIEWPEQLPLQRGQQSDAQLLAFAMTHWSEAPLDLLQGSYRRKQAGEGGFQRWKTAAVLLAVWLAVQAGAAGTEYFRLSTQNTQLTAAIEMLFRDVVPGNRPIRDAEDARIQMDIELRQLRTRAASGSRDDLLHLLGATAQAVGPGKTAQLENLTYREGRLDLSLTATNLQALERIKTSIQNDDITASIDSAQTQGSEVSARMRVEAKTP